MEKAVEWGLKLNMVSAKAFLTGILSKKLAV
jgi:hypothetical protein